MTKSTFWSSILVAYGLLLWAAGVLYTSPVEVEVFAETSNVGELVLYALGFFTVASFRTVGPTELGAKLLFGKPLYEVSSGLVFVPLGIFQLAKETRLVIQDELPADPEHIFRSEDVHEVPKGFFPPIRVPFGYPKNKNDLDDPLHRRITAEVVPIIRWRIEDFIQFLTVVGSRKEARRQMTDATVAMFFMELTKITPAEALENTATYNRDLRRAIINRTVARPKIPASPAVGDSPAVAYSPSTKSWGVSIEDAQIKAINFNRSLNSAIAEIPKKTAQAQATVITAKAEKEKRELEGKGAGAAERAILKGRTSGFRRMAEQLDVPATAVIGAETARAITESPGQKTIIPGTGGFANLVATAAAVGEAFRSDDKPINEHANQNGTPEEDGS